MKIIKKLIINKYYQMENQQKEILRLQEELDLKQKEVIRLTLQINKIKQLVDGFNHTWNNTKGLKRIFVAIKFVNDILHYITLELFNEEYQEKFSHV